MKNVYTIAAILLMSCTAISQVGIGNTDPKASLDISASSMATPSNTDGLLIPRIDSFPASNPTADQDGMMVFITGNGTPPKGFYYWNNNTTNWIQVIGPDGVTLDDAYDEGGAGAGRTIVADTGPVVITGTDGFWIAGTYGAGILFSVTADLSTSFFNPRTSVTRSGFASGTTWSLSNLGNYSVAMGYSPLASGIASVGFGYLTEATGDRATAMGNGTSAPSFSETAFGNFNTIYTPTSTSSFNSTDRLFSIGNGVSSASRSNALSIYKDGTLNINDAFTLPNTDGGIGQVLTTNGAGTISWATPSASEWTDGGTFLYPADGASEALVLGQNTAGTGKLSINANSSSTLAHIVLEESVANDGARLRFTNTTETAAYWDIYGFADGFLPNSTLNIFHSFTGNILAVKGDGDVEITGQLGINKINPVYALELPNLSGIGSGQARAFAWNTYSDGRVKSAQKTLDYGLVEIMLLTPKSYIHHNAHFSDDHNLTIMKEGVASVGFIAQEMYEVLPEAVQKPTDETSQLWSVDYNKVVPVVVKALQELNVKNNKLEEKIKLLEHTLAQYESVEARLSALEKNSVPLVKKSISVKKK